MKRRKCSLLSPPAPSPVYIKSSREQVSVQACHLLPAILPATSAELVEEVLGCRPAPRGAGLHVGSLFHAADGRVDDLGCCGELLGAGGDFLCALTQR